jgi:hypothetical protein
MNSLPPPHGAVLTLTGDYALAAIPARYSIELENGKMPPAFNRSPVASRGHRPSPGWQSVSELPAPTISSPLTRPNMKPSADVSGQGSVNSYLNVR